MAKKDDMLRSGLENLMGENNAATAKPGKPLHVCTVVPVDQMAKVREIARRECLPIKDVVSAALAAAITRYEKKHGPVVPPEASGDSSKLFM